MSRMSLICLGMIAVASTGCTYEGTVQCRFCDDHVETVVGSDCQNADEAIVAAAINCRSAGGSAEGPVTSRVNIGFCNDRAAVLDIVPNYRVREFLRSHLTRKPEPRIAPVLTCPAATVDLKITVYVDVGVQGCPNAAKEVQVLYSKALADGGSEFVTLSITVAVGGHHEFICTDAKVDEEGEVATFRVAVASGCECTFQEGCYIASAFSQMPGDGSSLEIHANLNTLILTPTIIPPPDAPASDATPNPTPSATTPQLVPIPDPKFTPVRR